ncbi:MAG: hypothetical protein II155_02765 [Clostridia bacterium]|nr:hypothetical protein [Clostridia bacterium]
MKKLVSLLLAALMLLSFAACSGNGGKAEEPTEAPASEPTSEQPVDATPENSEMTKLELLKKAEYVSSFQMSSSIAENIVRAEQAYCGKPIMICVYIDSIGVDSVTVFPVKEFPLAAYQGFETKSMKAYLPVEDLAMLNKGLAVLFGTCSLKGESIVMDRAYNLPFTAESEEEKAAIYEKSILLMERDDEFGYTFASILFKGIEDYSDSKEQLKTAEFGISASKDIRNKSEVDKYVKEHLSELTPLTEAELKETLVDWTFNTYNKSELWFRDDGYVEVKNSPNFKYSINGNVLKYADWSLNVYHIISNVYYFDGEESSFFLRRIREGY